MKSTVGRRRTAAALVVVSVMALGISGVAGQTTEELQREIRAMKAQLDELQQKMKQQQEVINKLSKQKPPATPAAAAEAPAPTPGAEADEAKKERRIEDRVTEAIMEKVQPSLAAANKTFPSQFNPAIGFIIDTVGSYVEHGGGNFEFRSGELGISANVDPYVRGYAIINGSDSGIEVEEAAIVTTSLPYNLTFKGGRFFADFGRLSKFHDHDLPFVNRPEVLDQYVGGESQANGVELNYLAPLDQYVTVTAGAYNKIGADNPQVNNLEPRALSQFTYLVHPATFFPISDANSVDLGATYAYTPAINSFHTDGTVEVRDGKYRGLAGIDVTYRYIPLSQASYRGLTWGTEVLYNHETFNDGSTDEPIFRATDAWGMYSYVEAKLTRVFYPGFLFQYLQPIDRTQNNTVSYSPYLTMWASEFQRIRAQYTYLSEPMNHESQFFLQWTVILGSHVHGFRDR
jgi:hypothetical protein